VGYTYPENCADLLISEFAKRIEDDHHNELGDEGIAVIYVDNGDHATSRFVQSFFPSTLCAKVSWKITFGTKAQVAKSKNDLVVGLKHATNQARDALRLLAKELRERDAKTPLLLPVKNFTSAHLAKTLLELQSAVVNAADKDLAIKYAVESLESTHPPAKDLKRYFVDDRKVEFRPPGSHRARHGLARVVAGHNPSCLLSGRRRLGAPYDRAFHYDCLRGDRSLVDDFFGCHDGPSRWKGNPHINIAPNDFVRA